MNSKDVIDFFGSVTAAAKALGISTQAVSQWGEQVPASRARNAELAMEEELRVRAREGKKERKK